MKKVAALEDLEVEWTTGSMVNTIERVLKEAIKADRAHKPPSDADAGRPAGASTERWTAVPPGAAMGDPYTPAATPRNPHDDGWSYAKVASFGRLPFALWLPKTPFIADVLPLLQSALRKGASSAPRDAMADLQLAFASCENHGLCNRELFEPELLRAQEQLANTQCDA